MYTTGKVTFYMIEVSHITKTYRVAKRDAGFINAFHSPSTREYEEIKALDDVSFTIQDGEKWLAT